MQGFFWRLFIGYWIVIVLSALFTIVILSVTTSSEISREQYRDRLLDITANELKSINLTLDKESLEEIFQNAPEFQGFYEVFIIDSNNEEIRNRKLPLFTRILLHRLGKADPEERISSFDPRINYRYIQSADGERYLILGRLNILVLGELLLRPGGRFVLVLSGIFLSGILSYLLARFIMQPVSKLQHAGRQIARGNLNVRISDDFQSRKDGLAELARDFDLMADKVDLLIGNQERLVADVSHELRSPLARLQASVSLARQKADGITSNELDRIEKESEALSDLIGQILTYSTLNSHNQITFETTDIVDLVRTIFEDAKYEGSIQKKNVVFRTTIDSLITKVNNNLIHSAIENIVRNAINYTPSGKTIFIELKLGAHSKSNKEAFFLTVEDQGRGVPELELERIFNPFYRVDGSRNSSSGGGGIGLAIAYRSTKIHGGEIYAENTLPEGLRVSLCIPIFNNSLQAGSD